MYLHRIASRYNLIMKETIKSILNKHELLTDAEAARYLRMSRVTLWRERTKGEIAFHRAGNRLLYSKADLQAYLDKNKVEAFN